MDCWSCGAERGDASFCPVCQKIQPLSRSATFFEVLGLPPRQRLEPSQIDRAFRDASKNVHPDRFGQTSAVERRLAVEHTASLNDAYRTLKDPGRRAEYLLKLQGVDVGAQDARTTDQALLLEMLELQELVEDASDLEATLSLERTFKTRQKANLDRLAGYFDDQQGSRTQATNDLIELRYLARLLERISNRIEEMS